MFTTLSSYRLVLRIILVPIRFPLSDSIVLVLQEKLKNPRLGRPSSPAAGFKSVCRRRLRTRRRPDSRLVDDQCRFRSRRRRRRRGRSSSNHCLRRNQDQVAGSGGLSRLVFQPSLFRPLLSWPVVIAQAR